MKIARFFSYLPRVGVQSHYWPIFWRHIIWMGIRKKFELNFTEIFWEDNVHCLASSITMSQLLRWHYRALGLLQKNYVFRCLLFLRFYRVQQKNKLYFYKLQVGSCRGTKNLKIFWKFYKFSLVSEEDWSSDYVVPHVCDFVVKFL